MKINLLFQSILYNSTYENKLYCLLPKRQIWFMMMDYVLWTKYSTFISRSRRNLLCQKSYGQQIYGQKILTIAILLDILVSKDLVHICRNSWNGYKYGHKIHKPIWKCILLCIIYYSYIRNVTHNIRNKTNGRISIIMVLCSSRLFILQESSVHCRHPMYTHRSIRTNQSHDCTNHGWSILRPLDT